MRHEQPIAIFIGNFFYHCPVEAANMPNIPYPEFNDFRLDLKKKVVGSSEPVEGYAFLSMNDSPNCVKGMGGVENLPY